MLTTRPFYVIGHNTNTHALVDESLAGGANAVEIDVTAYDHARNELCVGHHGLDGNGYGHQEDPSLADFLDYLRAMASYSAGFALVMFDVKTPAATPALGKVLLETIAKHLTVPGEQLKVIISVASLDNAQVFDETAG